MPKGKRPGSNSCTKAWDVMRCSQRLIENVPAVRTFPEVAHAEHEPTDPGTLSTSLHLKGTSDGERPMCSHKTSGTSRRWHSRAAGDETTERTRTLLDALAPFTSKAIRVTQSQDLLPDVVEDNLSMVHRILRDQG